MYSPEFYDHLGDFLGSITNLSSLQSQRQYNVPLETSAMFYQVYPFDIVEAGLTFVAELNLTDPEIELVKKAFFQASNPQEVSPNHMWNKLLHEMEQRQQNHQ